MRRACWCVSKHSSLVPPFLRYVIACTWLNGWCTAHRFQGRASCPFCRGPSDSLEHLAGCREVKALLGHYLGVAHQDFLGFLGLYTDFEAFARQALGLHATKMVVETTRLKPDLSARYSAHARFRADLQESTRKWPEAVKYLRTLAVMPRRAEVIRQR